MSRQDPRNFEIFKTFIEYRILLNVNENDFYSFILSLGALIMIAELYITIAAQYFSFPPVYKPNKLVSDYYSHPSNLQSFDFP